MLLDFVLTVGALVRHGGRVSAVRMERRTEGEETTGEENERNGTWGKERKGRSEREKLTMRENYLCCQLAMATTQLRCRDYLPRVSKTTSKTGGVRSRVSHKDIRSNISPIRRGINPLGVFKRVESNLAVGVAVGSRSRMWASTVAICWDLGASDGRSPVWSPRSSHSTKSGCATK